MKLIDKTIVTQRLCAKCSNMGTFACMSCTIPGIVRGIPEIEAEPVRHGRWIPCSERLPEIDTDVIVFYPHWHDNPIQVAHLNYDKLTFELSDGEFNFGAHSVTHWMPLPEPPTCKTSL